MGIKGSEKNTGRFPAEYKAYAAGDSTKKRVEIVDIETV